MDFNGCITYNINIEERTVHMKKKNFLHIIATVVTVIGSIFAATNLMPISGSLSDIDIPKNSLAVHYIDVGQGDSILIGQDDHFMLIDAGENDQGPVVLKYLEDHGVSSLEYVVGTHPHSDHIGGLDDVIENIDVENVILPKVVHDTKTYKDVLTAVSDKNLKITPPKPGDFFNLGSASVVVLAPNNSKYDEINDYSVVLKVTYGDNSFLFTGDAEKTSESEILKLHGFDLKSDVLKVGHHGSTTSSTKDFLYAVNPEYAVIQVGEDNDYNHPNQEILGRLNGTSIYRNDLLGTILAISDGSKIDFYTEKGNSSNESSTDKSVNTGSASDESLNTESKDDNSELDEATISDEPTVIEDSVVIEDPVVIKDTVSNESVVSIEDTIYIGNKNSSKFHKDTCENLPKESNRIYFDSREDAIESGYEPCKSCNP